MPTLTLVRGDKNFYIELAVRDVDGSTVDITGCSMRFKMQKYGLSQIAVDKEASVYSGTLGLARVLIEDEIQNISGEYYAELEIHFPPLDSTGKVLTAPDIYVKIMKDIPR